MNQQKEESKLEQAAKDYVMKSRLSSSSIDRLKDIARHTSFIAGAKSEAAKEYWQSLTTPAGKELDCEVFILIDGMIARIPKEHEDIFDVTFGSSYMLQVAKENGSYKVVNAVDGRGTNCFIHFKDKEVKVLFTNATPSKPNTVEEAGQTQEPVGGMKWEDVQILAKKHAEHIIEMGWRDNPDKDDIIADFISGYASAPPPAPIKTEGEDETQHQYENGEWSRSYTPQQEFPQSPSDILKKYSDSRFNVSMPFNWDILYRAMEDYANQFKTDPAPPSPVGIDVDALAAKIHDRMLWGSGGLDKYDASIRQVTIRAIIEGFKAGYAASPKPLKVIEQDDTTPMDKILMMDIPKPIGDFIIEQKDIVGTMGNDGMYYHYSQVCILLNRLKASIPQSSTELLKKAHWHGWAARERYTGPDRHGYEEKLPKNWNEMDYDEHEEWFAEQFLLSINLPPQSSTEEENGERMFTLEEMTLAWQGGLDRCYFLYSDKSVDSRPYPDMEQYFKQKFNIDL